MNCIYLWQVPSCDPLGLGQEYRCLFRNVCLAQLYRGSLWVNELGSAPELFMCSCLYLDFLSDRNPRAWCLTSAGWPYSPSEKGRLSQTQRDKQDTRMPKSTTHAWFSLSPLAQQLLDEDQQLAGLRIKVNWNICFYAYFLNLLLYKYKGNSGIFDLSFTAQLNYWGL